MDAHRLFKSYHQFSAVQYDDLTIWQAARVTSAAPTFFKRGKIGPPKLQEEFLDGGLGSNNPTKVMMREKDVGSWFKAKPGVYFRFNVAEGMQKIKMEDADKLANVKTSTIRYLGEAYVKDKVDAAVSVLSNPVAQVKASNLVHLLPSQLTNE